MTRGDDAGNAFAVKVSLFDGTWNLPEFEMAN
jgi:hypothetical protein